MLPKNGHKRNNKHFMKNILLLLFTIFFFPNLYSQEEFKAIGKTETGGNYYVKIDKSEPNKCSVWLKIEFVKTLKNKKGKKHLVNDGYQLNYMVFYCNEKISDNLEYAIYDKNNVVIDSGNRFEYGKRIFPESISESIYKYVCPVIINLD